jgi:uncharacterized membrane protein YtjA (UPF0391 family)
MEASAGVGPLVPSTASRDTRDERSGVMLHYALVFLIVGLVAGLLGLGGVAAIAGQIAWVLFLVALILIVVHMVQGRRPHMP